MISNYDLFMEFYKRVKGSKKVGEVLKEFGGSNLYIPSYKSTERNRDIQREFSELCDLGKSKPQAIRDLSTKYGLSYNRVQGIVRGNK